MDDLREILSRLEDKMDGMRLELTEIREKMATSEDVQKVAETLENIAVEEVAAAREKLEDRDDARDVLLKSLIDGLENRMTDRFESLENRFDALILQMGEGFKMLGQNQENLLKVIGQFVRKYEKQEEIMKRFDRELKSLQKRVDELGA